MNLFNVFPVKKPKGNMFNLSHERKMSFNQGELIPCLVQDIIPGDKFKVSTEVMIRLAPLLAPIMHRMNVYVHFFFVPNRLTWSDWELFITGGPDGNSSPTFPLYEINDVNKGNHAQGTLSDYMGLPSTPATVTQSLFFNGLPFRAYQMIYNEYYRDQNLTPAINVTTGSTYLASDFSLRYRCWEKDYFTSALPWSQRGGDVNLPLEGEIEFIPDYKAVSRVLKNTGVAASDGDLAAISGDLVDDTITQSRIENLEESTVYDLDNINLTINDLRQSVRLQEWLEKNARGGGRYVEQILSHFGVVSSDARLQRPEYLGGGKAPVVISEVLATADSGSADPGSLYGHGIAVANTNQFTKFFEEHGYVIGIISVLPRTCYQQGVERHFLKSDKFDYYFPEFANLGEQEIFNQEIYHDWTGAKVATDTWGYQSRYAEYKYKCDSVHGEFRSSLSYWHLGRIFSSAPNLNTSFVELNHTNAGVHRIHVVTDTQYDKIYCQLYNNVKAWRPMPKYGIPIL